MYPMETAPRDGTEILIQVTPTHGVPNNNLHLVKWWMGVWSHLTSDGVGWFPTNEVVGWKYVNEEVVCTHKLRWFQQQLPESVWSFEPQLQQEFEVYAGQGVDRKVVKTFWKDVPTVNEL